jgi:hypothetical protein
MPDKRCPNCGLYNPETALRCDCGYDFPSGTMKRPYGAQGEKQKRRLVTWVLLLLLLLSIGFVCWVLIGPAIGNVYQNIVTLTP